MIQVRVVGIIEETPRVRRFELVDARGGVLPQHTAGSHINVRVKLGDGSSNMRSYSVVNPPHFAGYYEIAVQRELSGRGGSAYMHDCVRLNDVLDIEPPKNHFPIADEAEHHVLIAGGIGITPILCMARALAYAQRDFSLHYVTRDPASMAFRSVVEGVCGERGHLYFDGGNPSAGLDLSALIGEPHRGVHAYVCGPSPMIDAALARSRERQWPENQLHFELFSNPLVERAAATDQAIEVELVRSGVTLQVQPGMSILDAILAAGIEADHDCRVGECGTCLTEVLEGMPVHRDYYLNDKERVDGRSMCTCVSWAKSDRLVLDL